MKKLYAGLVVLALLAGSLVAMAATRTSATTAVLDCPMSYADPGVYSEQHRSLAPTQYDLCGRGLENVWFWEGNGDGSWFFCGPYDHKSDAQQVADDYASDGELTSWSMCPWV